jgi:thiosulfate/3-mercaptopyruvate sulfurtransferase
VAAGKPSEGPAQATFTPRSGLPGLVDTAWVFERLGRGDLKIIDCRTHAEYTAGHLPGSVYLTPESFRGDVGGVPSMLLPARMLAGHLSLMGVKPSDTVVLVPEQRVRDATLIGIGLDRVGHTRWAVLQGGFAQWAAENRPLETTIPEIASTTYPAPGGPDSFTVDYRYVRDRVGDGSSVILDVRPAEYFTGAKSNEARPGHIPGAVNHPYTEDLEEDGSLKPIAQLLGAYRKLVPSKDTTVIVQCRTGHQASQTYFVLRHLLGYTRVKWYDASWTEWAARAELPAET